MYALASHFALLQDDYVLEMVRFGAAELHVVAAFIGGMASQVSAEQSHT